MITSRFFFEFDSTAESKGSGLYIQATKKSPGAERRGILPEGSINMYRGLLYNYFHSSYFAFRICDVYKVHTATHVRCIQLNIALYVVHS